MKRILFLSGFAALLCGYVFATRTGQGSIDTTNVVPSDNIVRYQPELAPPIPAAPKIAEPEPEPEKPFTSPDLNWRQLQGHVRMVKNVFDGSGSVFLNFDRQGNFVLYKDSKGYPYKIERNKNGQIVEWTMWGEDNDFYVNEKYYYNSEGYIDRIWSACEVYEEEFAHVLNEQGWPISSSWKREDVDGSLYEGTVTYTYSEIDDHGNWRKCEVECTDPEFISYTQFRIITYWE